MRRRDEEDGREGNLEHDVVYFDGGIRQAGTGDAVEVMRRAGWRANWRRT